jgi:predicted exporter
MHRAGLTERLAGFVLVVVCGALALRWAYEQLRPLLPVLVAVVVIVALWRVSSLIRRRW